MKRGSVVSRGIRSEDVPSEISSEDIPAPAVDETPTLFI
jgi:hypothetical protein